MIVDPAEDEEGVGESSPLCCGFVLDQVDLDGGLLRLVAGVLGVRAFALEAEMFAGALGPRASFSLCVVVVTDVVVEAASLRCGLLGWGSDGGCIGVGCVVCQGAYMGDKELGVGVDPVDGVGRLLMLSEVGDDVGDDGAPFIVVDEGVAGDPFDVEEDGRAEAKVVDVVEATNSAVN